MTYRLYLDDIRIPKSDGWIIVRTFDEAVAVIKSKGIPKIISFDHDLGLDQPTGFDFVKWLVNYDLDYDLIDPDKFYWEIHSMNPVGGKNIHLYLKNYMEVKKERKRQ